MIQVEIMKTIDFQDLLLERSEIPQNLSEGSQEVPQRLVIWCIYLQLGRWLQNIKVLL